MKPDLSLYLTLGIACGILLSDIRTRSMFLPITAAAGVGFIAGMLVAHHSKN
ncbi:MAG: hypothetical protein M0Z66_05745 [Thermaerobacter sp.]|nr:hypothetical protein [Thermaerobacter sp.]